MLHPPFSLLIIEDKEREVEDGTDAKDEVVDAIFFVTFDKVKVVVLIKEDVVVNANFTENFFLLPLLKKTLLLKFKKIKIFIFINKFL